MKRLQGVRVLHVDDDPAALEMVRRLLDREGAQCASAESAEEALLLLGQRPPDVLLVDLVMPGRDGFWLIRQVRARSDGSRWVPAAAVTGHGTNTTLDECFAAGFQLHVAKPLLPETLVQAVLALKGWTS